MPSIRISKDFTSGIYYLTFTVRNWYYIFDRHRRFDILADSLQYCQKHKGLNLYSYVFMLNHIHLIASSPDMIGFVRDFKKFTSKVIKTEKYLLQKIQYIHANPVRKQYVNRPEDWVWSSANPECRIVISPMPE